MGSFAAERSIGSTERLARRSGASGQPLGCSIYWTVRVTVPVDVIEPEVPVTVMV